ncbi:DUF4350 domain-containing protein [Fredinandcohnia sp. QZ13]|uniref:DUF4350 domain-containing protein n=1 Tax=Fredinandcohnia sp. QZ13 TaxID=3073144 RepID=UPI00285323B3|nr:DUF4350 domain-containing protein [Fredinandcohnia sp. QZ13]MDR4886191.1 DUF4350 domain-containing protein [Fredinandcohnia sp. QZ13]
MQNRKVWITLIGLIALLLLLTYFIESYNPKVYPHYVSDSPSPTGVKAIYTYLNDEHKVKKWSHSPNLLTNQDANQVLIMVEPYFTPEQEEADGYLDFIKAGNKIILFKSNPRGMFDIKTLPVEIDPFNEEAVTIKNKDGKEFDAFFQATNRIIPSEKEMVLLEDDVGVIATSRRIGEGELITTISPEWMLNGNLSNYDHIPLVLSLIEHKDVSVYYFDEYIHGTKNASTVTTLYPVWFLVFLLQGGIIVILWVWYKGKRFGPVIVPREETVRFSDESIQALSAWYLRGRYYHESINIQADYVKQLLQEKWGVPFQRDWSDLSTKLVQRWTGKNEREIKRYLDDLTNILKTEKLSKQDYLLWSNKLDELRKEVEKG